MLLASFLIVLVAVVRLLGEVVFAQPDLQPLANESAADVTRSPPSTPTTPLPTPLPKIAPRAALKDLLPTAPEARVTPVYTGDDLRCVPELRFEAAPKGGLTTEERRQGKAHTVAAALHLNAKDEDGFLKAMLKGRDDLAGVPFVMGDSCRTKGYRAAVFKRAVDLAQVRRTARNKSSAENSYTIRT